MAEMAQKINVGRCMKPEFGMGGSCRNEHMPVLCVCTEGAFPSTLSSFCRGGVGGPHRKDSIYQLHSPSSQQLTAQSAQPKRGVLDHKRLLSAFSRTLCSGDLGHASIRYVVAANFP